MQKNLKWIVVIIIVVLIFGWGISKYNYFVTINESITSQWSQVENQYQRRFDLIPNIVNTVKGIAGQEQKVFGDIAEARTKYSGAVSTNEKVQAASQVESALGRLLVIVENYPILQSSQAYRDLIVSLEGTENRISVERMKYNEMVKTLNASIKRFPNSILAGVFGVEERAYFEVPEENQIVPEVDFTE
ncbi:LemA family protein [Patescibacteria group bacterium]|nr:LemA family protein [Patescibacteria group bacterium]MBU4057675.1 LemA family protein [Patescibacteria group bacterium]MBU4116072.1 LemA family protein [Patescibacteria group bacterium]